MTPKFNQIFWLRDSKRNPVACVFVALYCTKEQLKQDDEVVSLADYGFSIYNPKDKLDKSLGRTIAEGRQSLHSSYSGVYEPNTPVTKKKALKEIINQIINRKDVPNRIKTLAKIWLATAKDKVLATV